MYNLINKKQVKILALDLAQIKAHKFNRVSKRFLDDCEGWLRVKITEHISHLPSKGLTIY